MPEYDTATDPRSSNSLIHGYLASKGLPLTGENVRRALEANAANPGTIRNDASTLVNSLPATEADDQAAMAAARGGAGAGVARSGGAPTPPVPPAGGGGNTSAPPGANTGTDDTSGIPLWQQILMGLATGGGFAAGSYLRNRGKQPGVAEPGAPAVNLGFNRPAIEPPSQGAVIGDRPGAIRLGGSDVNPGVAGVEAPRLLPGAGRLGQLSGPGPQFQVSGPDAQFSIGGPEAPKMLPAPLDARPVANPDVAIAGQRPAPPDVIPLPGSRVQPIQTPEQFIAANPGVSNPATTQALDKATAGTPVRARARTRVRIPVRVP